MKTSKKLIKKAICLFLIAILNINTFGAIVSDNDGSAFITKAEFDALKSSFQAQIDEYNTSIDSKIDGAIAAYLAGIKLSSEFQQECYPMGLSCIFYNSFVPFVTNTGDMYKYFMYVACMSCTRSGTYISEWKVSNYNGDRGSWVTRGSTKGLFVQYKNQEVNGTNLKMITSKVDSLPVSSISATGISMSNGSSTSLRVDSFNIDSSGLSNNYWGAAQWSVSTNAGASLSLVGTKTFTVEDTITYVSSSTFNSLNNFSGSALPSTVVYSILDSEYFLVGDYFTYASGTTGYRTGAEGCSPTSGTVTPGNHKIYIYRHKYSTLNWTSFSNENYSLKTNMDVRYYSGVPLFKATNDGRVTIKFKLSNSVSTDTNTFHLADSSFGNTTVSGGCTKIDNLSINDVMIEDLNDSSNFLLAADSEVKLEFDVKKGTTYWLKMNPTSGSVSLDFSECVIKADV